jgi:hypothetical protein
LKIPITTKRAGGVAQGVGPEFKPQYCKKKEVNVVRYMYFLFWHVENKRIYLLIR